jgi:hypothetical protein
MSDPTSPAADSPEPGPTGRRLTPGRLVLVALVIGMLSMWAYVVYLAFGPGRQPPVDRLDDPAFAEAGQDRCAEAIDLIDGLPSATSVGSPAERADVLDQANAELESMLDDLDAMTSLVPDAHQRGNAEEWLADWRVYLGDRQDYAEAVRTDGNAALLVSEKEGTGRQITGWIDEFALSNKMDDCVTPTDA